MLVAAFLLWRHSDAAWKEKKCNNHSAALVAVLLWWQCHAAAARWSGVAMSCTAIVARRHQVDCVVCVSGGRHHYRFQFLFCAVALATSLRVVLPALATAFHRAGCCILRRRGIATFRNAATPATFWMIPFSLRKAAQATPLSRGSFILFFYITMPLSGAPQLEVSFSSPESGAADTPFWKFLCFF